MARLRSENNARVLASVRAIARAHATLPGFEYVKAKDLAVQLDRLLAGHRNMESIFALAVALLFALGDPDAADRSRYVS